ncbi:uncharacterized protein LOC143422817 [Xylocopa sonorina]|uniref:uncharacterized protein LOC143422817 n=1 Tax=Xylocopa sonorina TaxID=1818115 RepID=UPI00403AFD29
MKLAYIICVLLASTICCIATNDGKKQEDAKVTNQQTPDIIPLSVPVSNGPAVSADPAVSTGPIVPAGSTIPAVPVVPVPVLTQNSNSVPPANSSIIVKPTDNTTSINSKDTSVPTNGTSNNTSTPNSNSNKTKSDDITQGPITQNPVEPSITPSNPPVTSKPPTVTEPGSSTSTTNGTSTVSSAPGTTAVPVSTKVAPNNERHFDGLSFMGGILLATCLMAIAAFSWKFYRTLNGRNYGSL